MVDQFLCDTGMKFFYLENLALIAIVVNYLHSAVHANDEALILVSVVNEVTSREEGTVTKESEIESKTSGIEVSAKATSGGKPWILSCHAGLGR